MKLPKKAFEIIGLISYELGTIAKREQMSQICDMWKESRNYDSEKLNQIGYTCLCFGENYTPAYYNANQMFAVMYMEKFLHYRESSERNIKKVIESIK